MFTAKTRRWLLLIVVGVCLVTVVAPVMFADAAQYSLPTKYFNLLVDFNGTWDKEAYWGLACLILPVPDYSYLYAWVGLGWDKICRLTSAPSGKITLDFYNDPKDVANAWSSGATIKVNLAHFADLTVDNYVTEVAHLGNTLTHESSHSIFKAVVGTFDPGGNLSGWLTESLAYYAGDCLWPWGNDALTGPKYTKEYVKQQYKATSVADAPGWNLLYMISTATIYDNHFLNPPNAALETHFNNAWWTFHAVGFYLSSTAGDSTVPLSPNFTSLYKVGDLLNGVKNGYASGGGVMNVTISNAYKSIWGKTLIENTFAHGAGDSGDFYYGFYNYWWL